MVEDPKDSIFDLLTANINESGYEIYKDDDTTEVAFTVQYDLPIETIQEILTTDDLVITIKQGTSSKERLNKGTLMDVIPIDIEIWLIDKYTAGTRVVTGTLVRWKAKNAILNYLKDIPNSPGGDIEILRLVRDSDDDMTTTRPYLYHSILSITVTIFR